MSKIYLAVDLGAGSGRVMACHYNGSTLTFEEMHRFPDLSVNIQGSNHWDILYIYHNILEGIRKAIKAYPNEIVSLGVDTWGVDYGLLDKEGKLLGNPYQYRDKRTDGMMEKADKLIGNQTIYAETGIQFMFFNTIFQLMSENKDALDRADKLLFIPDLIGYWLSGHASSERTIASTAQLFNPKTEDWSKIICEKADIPMRLFPDMVEPNTIMGPLTEDVSEEVGQNDIQVIKVAGHDTGSAVVGVPAENERFAFLSSGTWSLLGIEVPEAIINDEMYDLTFSNELGVEGTTRLLKNICGLWLIQQSKAWWDKEGDEIDYATLAKLSEEAPAFLAVIDPDDERFGPAGNIPGHVQDFCRETNQTVPETKGQILRVITESLALKTAIVLSKLEKISPHYIDTIHMVGGGTQNLQLNQFVANACDKLVQVGPVEATAIGNVLMQMKAMGDISSLAEGRKIIRNTYPPIDYKPEHQSDWKAAKDKLRQIIDQQASIAS